MTLSNLPLSYCTNVHPARCVDDVLAGLRTYTANVQRRLREPIAAGLWLSNSVVEEIAASPKQLTALTAGLQESDLACYTLNTFPFGDFHHDRVKEQVYLPDWSDPRRLDYTLRCAEILATLLPPETDGSLSTVPLGGRMNHTSEGFHEACVENLLLCADRLAELRSRTGRTIRLAIEPEPLCHLSSVPRDTIPFFERLFAAADASGRGSVVRETLGVCFDVCHQAVEFEDVMESINLLVSSGIQIVKVHITCAVELEAPARNHAGLDALCRFVEPRYLHQTYAKFPDGSVQARTDLLLDDIRRDPPDEFLTADVWRVHFHVPVYADSLGPLGTTRGDLRKALQRIGEIEQMPHLEVETYTWPVMPDDAVQGQQSDPVLLLTDRIARELIATKELLQTIRHRPDSAGDAGPPGDSAAPPKG